MSAGEKAQSPPGTQPRACLLGQGSPNGGLEGFSPGSPGVGTLVPSWAEEGGDRQIRLVKSFGPRWDFAHNGAEGVSRRRVGVTEGDRRMGRED